MVLLVLILGWIGLRAAIWNETDGARLASYTAASNGPPALAGPGPGEDTAMATARPTPEADARPRQEELAAWAGRPVIVAGPVHAGPGFAMRLVWPSAPGPPRPIAWTASDPRRPALALLATAGASASQSLMWLAALSRLPAPALYQFPPAEEADALGMFVPPAAPIVVRSRWSADGWVMLRRHGDTSLSAGASPAAYGDSQAGAVLRYRLAAFSGHRPAVYGRASRALDGSGETDAALGLQGRPVPAVPVLASAEMRVTRQGGRTRIRPAAMLISEFPPVALPLQARAEVYAQAGYVGGAFATAFADAQVHVDMPVVSLGAAELRAGGGAWLGAQKHVSRVDVGPSATVTAPVSDKLYARLALDWRFRVAGNAVPASGPALTLSAGF